MLGRARSDHTAAHDYNVKTPAVQGSKTGSRHVVLLDIPFAAAAFGWVDPMVEIARPNKKR